MDNTPGGIPVKVKYSDRRTLSMKFDREGTLIVSAPLRMKEKEVRDFLNDNIRWIRKNYVKIAERKEEADRIRIEDGGAALYLGEELRVRFNGRCRVHKMGDELVFPDDADMDTYVRWLKARAKEYLPARLSYRAYEMGIDYRQLRISSARSKWGSCSASGQIVLAWHLMMCPTESIEYVIIHELCHRLHMDHSKAFWAEVERFMPDYKKYKKWLDDHSYIMDIL